MPLSTHSTIRFHFRLLSDPQLPNQQYYMADHELGISDQSCEGRSKPFSTRKRLSLERNFHPVRVVRLQILEHWSLSGPFYPPITKKYCHLNFQSPVVLSTITPLAGGWWDPQGIKPPGVSLPWPHGSKAVKLLREGAEVDATLYFLGVEAFGGKILRVSIDKKIPVIRSQISPCLSTNFPRIVCNIIEFYLILADGSPSE